MEASITVEMVVVSSKFPPFTANYEYLVISEEEEGDGFGGIILPSVSRKYQSNNKISAQIKNHPTQGKHYYSGPWQYKVAWLGSYLGRR